MKWILVTVMVVATVLSDLLQSFEMKRAGQQSVGARGLMRLLKEIARRRFLILAIGCMAVSFFSFMALVQTEPLSFAVPASAASFVLETLLAKLLLRERIGVRRAVGALIVLTVGAFNRDFRPYARVMLTSDRAGLVMEPGAKVKLRGVQVGRVASIQSGDPVKLQLELYPEQLNYIPANVTAEITAPTAFGANSLARFMIPLGTATKPMRVGRGVTAANAGVMASSRGRASAAPVPFKNVRRCRDF